MTAPARRFELDRSVRPRDGGRLLCGGAPARLVRLSDAGAAALAAILAGEEAGPPGAALTARLERAGLLHPLPDADARGQAVTAVVPVRDGGAPLVDLVRTLAAEGPVIVVDDGSRDGSSARAAAAGAEVLANAGRPGPAGARNTGLRAATTDLVAFLDADCQVAPGWRAGLAGLLDRDRRLAVVAPRVRSPEGDSAIDRYELANGPLDLGPDAGLVGPGRRIAYLPAAALVVRREALAQVGGFEEGMRFGEDVDLIWRLLAADWRVRYAPSREILHLPRATVAGLARQRAGYGSSAPALAERHGAAAAPLRAGRHTTAIWAAGAVLGAPALAPALAASTAIVAARSEDPRARVAVAEVALLGNAAATRHLARVLVREWLPLSLACGLTSARARRFLLAALVIDSLPVWRRARRPTELVRLAGLHAIDRGAYATGLWREMARRRDLGALLPRRP